MTPRERVLTALNHQEPDRVPVALGGGPYGLVDDLYFKLLPMLNLGDPVAPFRTGHNISYQDDRLFERLGTDTRYVWPGASPSSPSQETADPDRFLDGFGQPWRRALPYYYADKGILAEANSIDDIDRLITWPDPQEPHWTAGVRERAQTLREKTPFAVVARMVTSHGPYQTACNLRGMEAFMMDLALNKEFAAALLERITDSMVGLLKGYLAACGDYIDLIELPGDDYAGNETLIISPRMFNRFIKPTLARLIETVKAYRPEIKVMLHSDGAITKLLPSFVELGVDVVHPLEPLPAMDLPQIKADFGNQLAFIGGIDISRAMPGSQTQVIAEAKTRIAQLAPGGGYILAPANHLQADVPPANVITLFEAAHHYGKYPLKTEVKTYAE
jgi:uroporphyrinogen decarboxylase